MELPQPLFHRLLVRSLPLHTLLKHRVTAAVESNEDFVLLLSHFGEHGVRRGDEVKARLVDRAVKITLRAEPGPSGL